MNILLINHYAGSPEMGMEFRPYYFAREWTKMGHQVTIIAGDFSHLRMKNPEVFRDFQRQDLDGIRYCWVKTGTYEGNGSKRALSMFRFVSKLWIHARQIVKSLKPDVVIASSTYPLDTYAAQKIAKISGAKLIHEVHDMWPATLYEVGGMSRWHPFVLLMQMAENSAYRKSDKVVSLPPLAKEYMVKHGMEPTKFIPIPNGIVEEEWKHPAALSEEHTAFLEELKREKYIVGYFGGHALSNALDILLDTAKKINDEKTVFVLVGNGAEKERLKKRKEDEKIDNVFFLPPVSKKAVPALVSYFDCIYMGSLDSPLYRFGICMNKVFDSMMSGKPIVCAITTPVSPVSQCRCGMMVRSGDTDGIIDAVNTMKEMSEEERKQMGENGRNAALNHFTYTRLAKKFAELFEEE